MTGGRPPADADNPYAAPAADLTPTPGSTTRPPCPARLAGFVMGILGLFTFGTTSPYAVLLSAEKFWEPDRSRSHRALDAVGLTLGVLGCVPLPYFLNALLHYVPIGRVPVSWYLGFLGGWAAHRVLFVWRRPWSDTSRP